VRFQNGSNKVAIELRVVQFWSEIILVISNRTSAQHEFDFEITRMISDQIALHSVQLHIPLCTLTFRSEQMVLVIVAVGISSLFYHKKRELITRDNQGRSSDAFSPFNYALKVLKFWTQDYRSTWRPTFCQNHLIGRLISRGLCHL